MSRPLPLLTLLLFGFAAVAWGQPRGGPDLADLALLWARGDYRAPLICEIDGTPHRGLRRIQVTPGPRHTRPPSNRLTLFDLELPAGAHCFDVTGSVEPNLLGTIYFGLDTVSRPDIAEHDFKTLLRREGGVEFQIRRGRVRLGAPGADAELREVDFGGGTARFALVERGSDAFRRLAEFVDLRKLSLRLEAPDGTRVEFDLVQTALR